LAIVGVGAGGSLMANVMSSMQSHANLFGVNVCGRVQAGPTRRWDPRTIARSAYSLTKQPCFSFYEAVTNLDRQIPPPLSDAAKARMRVVRGLADPVVPRYLMAIPGVETQTIPAIGHNMGVAAATFVLPGILDGFERHTPSASA